MQFTMFFVVTLFRSSRIVSVCKLSAAINIGELLMSVNKKQPKK